MTRPFNFVVAALTGSIALPAAAQNWVTFVNQSSTRMISGSSVGTGDTQEKDYAYADFDQDGDVDLVVVRKVPFSVPGPLRNVLFMNEGIADGQSINGVLVDRTAQYASAATDGGQGMLDLTDDRDVTVADVNGDGWLDIITATTYGPNNNKSISHPRIYINLGEVAGVWQGFRYEENRFPNFGSHPNFCGVAAGDVTGDKMPDLYFVSYDRTPAAAFDDKLVINNGSGFFTDQTTARLTSAMYTSGFGTACHIADFNGDGNSDIIKSENGPVKIMYNNAAGTGNFSTMSTPYSASAYHVNVGDLNQDGRIDLIISDDGTDKYLLNTTIGSAPTASFSQFNLPESPTGFNGEIRFADLNNDGFVDAINTDVDVDLSGCSRTTRIYRNLGNLPNITMSNQSVGGLTSANLTGVHDVAVFDLDGDGWKDIIVGRCSGTQIWIQQPPSGMNFTYPQGLPGYLGPNQPTTFQVKANGIGAITPQPNTGVLSYAVGGNSFANVPMTHLGDNLYSTTLPAVECAGVVKFYVSVMATNGSTYRDPAQAPFQFFTAIAATGTQTTVEQRFEGDVTGWTVLNQGLTGGAWEQAIPNPTIFSGSLAAPDQDAGNGDDVKCFVTENGPPGGAANANDVDGGPTWLTSPTIDLAGTDGTVSYSRWFFCSAPNDDQLFTEVSNNNGATWVPVHSTHGTGSAWEVTSFRVGDFVTPTAQVRVRFWTADPTTSVASVTEAGIDNFHVEQLVCQLCAADVNRDGTRNFDDILAIIAAWGGCPGCPEDVNGDGVANFDDVLEVIAVWGDCP